MRRITIYAVLAFILPAVTCKAPHTAEVLAEVRTKATEPTQEVEQQIMKVDSLHRVATQRR